VPKKLTKEIVLKKFKLIHGNKYTYKIENYKNVTEEISIHCKKHGVFIQRIDIHLRGAGCPKCAKEKMASKFKQSRELVIDRFVETHGDKYNYNLVKFTNCKDKVDIICPEHGIFSQKVESHYKGHGCPKCAQKKTGEKNHFNRLYQYKKNEELGSEGGTFYKVLFTHKPTGLKFVKIGITSVSVEERYRSKYSNFDYEIIDQIHCSNLESAELEQAYKAANKDKRFYLPDSIQFQGKTECYEYDEEQQATHKQLSLIREHLLKKQKGKCAICDRKAVRPVVDHHHKKKVMGSGKIRGVLCATCNTFLARIENNFKRHLIPEKLLPECIRHLADYIEQKTTNWIHPSEKPKVKKLGKRVFQAIAKAHAEASPKAKKLEYPKSGKPTKRLIELAKKYKIDI